MALVISSIFAVSTTAGATAATGTRCSLYQSDCYHNYVGKTFNTRYSCVHFAAFSGYIPDFSAYSLGWIHCIARPPVGYYYLSIFYFNCPGGYSAQWCRYHHYT